MSGPLADIKVVDLSRVLAGPWATQLMADLGADVIKVERPGVGDDTRHWGPPWLKDESGKETPDAAYFLSTNRNKRSITVDIAHPDGQAVIKALVADADVFVENFKVGTMARYGLAYEDLAKLNSKLVYCSVSAYGQDSSKSGEPGYDAMMQASGGLMSLTGEPAESGGRPQKVGVAIADIMAGMYAATAIMAALNVRQSLGSGQYIDLSLYDSQVAWLANQNMNYLLSGDAPPRFGTAHPNIVPYQSFPTLDGEIVIAVGNDRQFAELCRCIGDPELADDPDYCNNAMRVRNREDLVERISKDLARRTTNDLLQDLCSRNVPAGPVRDLQQVFDDPFADERQLVRSQEHSTAGPVPSVANPLRFSATPVVDRMAPPVLGEHTESVLRDDLGYSPEKIRSLYDDGAI